MTNERKEELRQLLEESIENIVIEPSKFVEPITVDTYRENLQSLQKHYRPDLATRMSFYHLDIRNETLKSKLLNFINVQFKNYINNEHNVIQPASYGIGSGGSLSGQPIEILLTKLIEIAISTTVQRAIEAVEKSVTETKGSFKRVILLQGPTTHPEDMSELTEIDISEGIRLVRLPYYPQEMPPYLFPGGFSSLMHQSHPSIFSLKAILVIDCEVAPLFVKPELIITSHNSDGSKSYGPKTDANPFQIKIKCTEYPDFDVELFCQAISLSCNIACAPILEWGYIDPDEIYSVIGTGSRPTAKCVLPSGPTKFDSIYKEQIPKIKDLYENMVGLKKDIRTKLQISIDRWVKSETSQNPEDKIIDLAIALESLYLSNISDTTEVSFRLRLHAAWFLKEKTKDRKDLMDFITEIYKCRSSIVHNGILPKKKISKNNKRPYTQEEIKELISKAQNLCQESILKILEDGGFPDWNNLILGEKSS